MKPSAVSKGKHYTASDVGPPQDWGRFVAEVASLPGVRVPGKAFLAEALNLTGMEISVNVMPPGGAVPFRHKHRRHEETYFVIAGHGQMQVDGEVIELQSGSVVSVMPDGDRTWRNTGSEPLYYIVIQAVAGTLEKTATEDGYLSSRTIAW